MLNKITQNKKTSLASAVLLLAVIIIAISSLLWLRYVNNTFTPLINALDATEMTRNYWEGQNRIFPTISYSRVRNANDVTQYSITVSRPRFLRREGNISFLSFYTIGEADGEIILTPDYRLDITYLPGERNIVLFLADLTTAVNMETRTLRIHEIAGSIDRNGNPLPMHPQANPAYHQQWLGLYERAYASIMAMLAHIKDMFGDTIFTTV